MRVELDSLVPEKEYEDFVEEHRIELCSEKANGQFNLAGIGDSILTRTLRELRNNPDHVHIRRWHEGQYVYTRKLVMDGEKVLTYGHGGGLRCPLWANHHLHMTCSCCGEQG